MGCIECIVNRRFATRRLSRWLALAVVSVAGCDFPRPEDVPDPGGMGNDTTAPTVISANPAPHAAGVAATLTAISVTFSEPIDPASGAQFAVSSAGVDVAGTASVNGATLTFTPSAALPAGAPLAVTVDRVADLAGNRLAAAYSFAFTTKHSHCVKVGGGDDCYALPSQAVAAAGAGASIAIAAGNYVDNLALNTTVTLLGGFDATFTTRDPAANLTTIRPREPADANVPIVGVTGGALLLDGVTLTDGRTNGEHGGALRISGGTPRIHNSVIAGNQASFLGGGIYITGGATVQLIGNRIENNTLIGASSSGAGVAIESSTVVFRDNVITGNRVSGMDTRGGGIVLYDTVATLVDNHIDDNHVGGNGEIGNGGGLASFRSTVTMTGGSLSFNDTGSTTGSGGGLYVDRGEVRLDGVRIEGNAAGPMAGAGGSGVHAITARLVVAGSIISANLGGSGGLVVGTQASAVVLNCTIADNPVRGIHTSSTLTVVNSVILREPVGITVTGSPAPSVLVKTNALFSNTANADGLTLDSTNLVGDPLVDTSFHLMAGSPLIDAGQAGPIQTADQFAPPVELPARDIDGDSRTLGARPDIGADEFRSN